MKSPIMYYGGKTQMISRILPFIPPHKIYIEAFVGGGAVFFSKEKASLEVINDLNTEVINFYRILKLEPEELIWEIKNSLKSRYMHSKARDIYFSPHKHTDVERAWSFWYVSNGSFNNMCDGMYNFSTHDKKVLFSFTNKRERYYNNEFIYKLLTRIENTEIECRDAVRVIQQRDNENAFFYVDPPYVKAAQGHYRGYKLEDYLELLEQLSKIKGKFLLSCYPGESLNRYMKENDWYMFETTKLVTADKIKLRQRQTRHTKTEVLVMNYDPTELLFEYDETES